MARETEYINADFDLKSAAPFDTLQPIAVGWGDTRKPSITFLWQPQSEARLHFKL